MCRWRLIYHAVGLGQLSGRSRFSSAGRCTIWFISSPAARSAPMASTAGCSPATARWRGTGPGWLARVARRLRAVGAADVADAGRRARRRCWCRSPRRSASRSPARRAASFLLAVCLRFAAGADASARQPFGQRLQHVSRALCLRRLAAICAAGPARCSPPARPRSCSAARLVLSWAAAVALGNVAWALISPRRSDGCAQAWSRRRPSWSSRTICR